MELQTKMGFQLQEFDVTLKPDVITSKGIRALPVIEINGQFHVGNATSEQLVAFITENSSRKK
ncbi:MAG TPA: hypothetical protein VMU30_08060 [Bacteroidota bacterium]|nr:hypothetical protein [Bacteroidota bacterium]